METSLYAMQMRFAQAIVEAEQGECEDLDARGPVQPSTGLGVYRHAYRQRLIEALQSDHETLTAALGEERFTELVRKFIEAYPSQYFSLRYFGDKLPVFMREQAMEPIHIDLARFERTLLDAFDAPEVPSRLAVDALTGLEAEQWPQLQVCFHPSVRGLEFNTNAMEWWHARKAERAWPEAKDIKGFALIYRNSERLTEFRSVDALEREMFLVMNKGGNFAEACEALTQQLPFSQVPPAAGAILRRWLESGVVASFTFAP